AGYRSAAVVSPVRSGLPMLARRRFAGRHRALRPGLAPLRPVPPGCWKAAPGLRWRFPFPRQVAARRPRGGLRPARSPPGSPPAPTGPADVARGAAPAALFALSPHRFAGRGAARVPVWSVHEVLVLAGSLPPAPHAVG